jgi:molybdate transport system ATP-binding protein
VLRLRAELSRGPFALDVECEVQAGTCVALAGPSGAGKTTVLRIAAGLLRPARGRVTCGGEVWDDVASGVHRSPEDRRVGFVFQDYALFPHLRAWQNVAYPLRGGRRRERALELLDRFGLAGRADARPRTLSGGERQRVALARALAREPAALLLDEPLSALDARTRARAARELGEILRAAGVPTLLVTHDFAEAALLGDRVAVLDEGRIVQAGTAAELAAAPASAFVADFTGANVLLGMAGPAGDGLTRVRLDGGGELVCTDRAEGPVAVSLYPWEVAVEPAGAAAPGSARNHLPVEVVSVTVLGNRVRVGLAAPQPLAAEITEVALRELDLRPGVRAGATVKAAAIRLLPR